MISQIHLNTNVDNSLYMTLQPTCAVDSLLNRNSNLLSKIYNPSENQVKGLLNHASLYPVDGATDWSSSFMIVITIVSAISAIVFAMIAVYAFTAGLFYDGFSSLAIAIFLGIKAISDLSELSHEEKKLEAFNNKEAIKKQIEEGFLLQAFKKIENLDLSIDQDQMNFILLVYPYMKACIDKDDIESLKKMAMLISDSVKNMDPFRRNHLESLIIATAKMLTIKSDIESARFLLLTTGGLSKGEIQDIMEQYNRIKDELKGSRLAPVDEYIITEIIKINKSRKHLFKNEDLRPVFTVAD